MRDPSAVTKYDLGVAFPSDYSADNLGVGYSSLEGSYVSLLAHRHHAEAHVENPVHLLRVYAALPPDQVEYWRHWPRTPLKSGTQVIGQEGGDLSGESTSGNVGQALGQPKHRLQQREVTPVADQQLLAQLVPQLVVMAEQYRRVLCLVPQPRRRSRSTRRLSWRK